MSVHFWFHCLSTVKSKGTYVLHWKLFYVAWFQLLCCISSVCGTKVGAFSALC